MSNQEHIEMTQQEFEDAASNGDLVTGWYTVDGVNKAVIVEEHKDK